MKATAVGLSRVLIAALAVMLPITQLMLHGGSALAGIGDITEYPVPTANSAPLGIAAGPDGNLWITEASMNKVAKVTTSGVITEYTIPTASSGPAGIAAGPDGNLWFVEGSPGANNVAKVTTSGVFTEYPIPTAGSEPYGIAAGPDGDLWFTELLANKVAKVTTSGAVTEYPVPTSKSNPYRITAGPDGNMWFTEINGSKVAKVTTTGAITEFPTPTAGSDPDGIATGPDGNLWITETHANQVARLTTSGYFIEYGVPYAAGVLEDITAGPDGNLWFTEQTANVVVKWTTLASFTAYPLPTANGAPIGIATGPDGNVWFTEHNASKVGKVVAAPPATFHPMSPVRVLDTRTSGQTLAGYRSLNLQLAGSSVPSDATAVVMNVTATNTSAAGFLLIVPAAPSWSSGTSNLNWTAGETVADLVQIALGIGGQVTISNGSSGAADVVVDLEGYFAPSGGSSTGGFVPLPPDRITDTRAGSGWPNAGSTLGEGGSLDVQVTGAGGVPATGVTGVVLNATVTNTTGTGFLTAFPKGSAMPLASNINWTPGTTVANRVIVPVGAGGMLSFFNSSGLIDLIVDVNGYFTDSTASGSSFVPVTPLRILDTRAGGFNMVGQGASIAVPVAGRGGVPRMTSATPPTAVVLSVTATDPTTASYLTVWPDLVAQPTASDLNFLAGQSVPSLVVVKMGANGNVAIYNAWGSTDVVVDLLGWYG